MTARSVDSPHYHLWTDALHGRHLATNARNDWDRGTYVRWTINSAWSAFEVACAELLSADDLGMRFRERLDKAMANKGLPAIDWGRGVWQRVLKVYGLRKDYTHGRVAQERLFAPTVEASEAIEVLRAAVLALHELVGEAAPNWVMDDANPEAPIGSHAHLTVSSPGAERDHPSTVRVTYVFQGREYESAVLTPGSDPEPAMERILRNTLIPLSSIRSYEGDRLVNEWSIRMRGT